MPMGMLGRSESKDQVEPDVPLDPVAWILLLLMLVFREPASIKQDIISKISLGIQNEKKMVHDSILACYSRVEFGWSKAQHPMCVQTLARRSAASATRRYRADSAAH